MAKKEMAKKDAERKTSSENNVASDAASQVSKETSHSGKNKGWARSLKKATNSILYMAMPPTSVDNMPMVVAQTPMSPDRLVPSLHSSIFQSPLLTTVVTPTSTVTASPLAPVSSTFVSSASLESSVSVTAASSSASVATSSIASSSKGHKESFASESHSTSHHRKQSSSSSNSSARAKKSSKGKERAVPLSPEVLGALETPSGPLDYNGKNYSSLLVSPPSSPPSKRDAQDSFTAAALEARLPHGIKDDNTETLPSPPPSPRHVKASKDVRQDRETSKATLIDDLEFEALVQSALAESGILEASEDATVEVKTREMVLPMFPAEFSTFDLSLEMEMGKSVMSKEAVPLTTTSEVETTLTQITAPIQGTRQDIVVATVEELETASQPVIAASVIKDSNGTESMPLEVTPHQAPEHFQSQHVQKSQQSPGNTRDLTFNEPAKPLPAVPFSPVERKAKPRNDVPPLSSIPPRSLSLARSLSRDSSKPRPVKNAPWLWHQDGITHQRLESHQILTKEQVFEQFHLDLEQDGPNGFFLFKLVRRFKRQDSSLLGISSSLLDAELSASPSSSPPNYGSQSPSILDQIDAVSVSQKLKRQLLLQKRKKQRKASSSDPSELEEDENLEALLSMSTNNTSLHNLNSSLQDVLDAVDSLKETQDWATLLDHPLDHSRASSIYSQAPEQATHAPDSDNEYTSREKDAMDGDALEKKRGVYATGRTDGLNLISKKKLKAVERRASMSTSTSTSTSRKGSNHTSGPIPSTSKNGSDHMDTEAATTGDGSASQSFKKQAVSQLHIYSRNGLKFKFDVMQDNELHFVEASKKYTFMDPLAAHRQPDLDNNSQDALSPLRNPAQTSASLPPINGVARRTSSGQVSTVSSDGKTTGPRRRNTQSSTTSSNPTGGRRVFVTRLGRHSLLTYPEYKVLAKSASGFTLGAKLLIQRSIAVATPGFYGSGQSNGHSREATSYGSDSEYTAVSPTHASFGSQAHPTPTPSGGADSADYFSTKKSKSRGLTGFASKAVNAIKSPTSPTSQGGKARPIVTPYNPSEYKNKSLTVAVNTPAAEDSSPYTPTPGATDIPWSESFPMPPGHPASPSSTVIPEHYSSSPPSTASLPNPLPTPPTPSAASGSTPSTPSAASSSSNPYNSLPIKRQGNQAGIKFQHLFVTVHQRLQKLELENGVSFYRSTLVQWTVIDDVAELRWWRDKIGIQMIGRLEGDPWSSCSSASTLQNSGNSSSNSHLGSNGGNGSYTMPSTPSSSLNPMYSSTLSVGSSYLSAQSTISDASSSSSLSVAVLPLGGYTSKVSVERLGYRFLRVSGHMGTMKVTVSEQVEARAVALAVKAEMLKQKKKNQLQDGIYQEPAAEDLSEWPWVEVQDVFDEDETEDDDESNDDHEEKNRFVVDNEDEDEKWGVDGSGPLVGESANGIPIQSHFKESAPTSANTGDVYEYDEWTGQKSLKKTPGEDKFSRRKRHDRAAAKAKKERRAARKNGTTKTLKQQGPLIERMTMIVGQAKVFKGDWYMKNVYKSY